MTINSYMINYDCWHKFIDLWQDDNDCCDDDRCSDLWKDRSMLMKLWCSKINLSLCQLSLISLMTTCTDLWQDDEMLMMCLQVVSTMSINWPHYWHEFTDLWHEITEFWDPQICENEWFLINWRPQYVHDQMSRIWRANRSILRVTNKTL